MGRHLSKHWMPALLLTMAVAAFGLAAPAAHATDRPPAPTNLQVTDVGWRHVAFSWEAPPPDLDWQWYYEITNVTTGDREFPGYWQTTDRPPFSLAPDTTYTFEIRLVNPDGVRSAPSNRVTATTVALPHVPAPGDLEATDVFANSVYLSWGAAAADPDLKYQVTNLTTGSRVGWRISELSTVATQRPGVTNSYEVVAVDEESGAVSDASNRLTITTPHVEPPDDVQAVRDGNDVTLTWSRPDVVDPKRATYYLLNDNDVPVADNVALTAGADGSFQVTLERVVSGVTHTYTVEAEHGLEYWPNDTNNSEPSEPVSVTVPPTGDTTPPTAPAAVMTFVYETGVTTFEITEQSTDDTTPQSEIHYEALTRRVYGDNKFAYLTYDFDLPHEFDDSTGRATFPQWIRAVDEVGNRSEIVSPEFVVIED